MNEIVKIELSHHDIHSNNKSSYLYGTIYKKTDKITFDKDGMKLINGKRLEFPDSEYDLINLKLPLIMAEAVAFFAIVKEENKEEREINTKRIRRI